MIQEEVLSAAPQWNDKVCKEFMSLKMISLQLSLRSEGTDRVVPAWIPMQHKTLAICCIVRRGVSGIHTLGLY